MQQIIYYGLVVALTQHYVSNPLDLLVRQMLSMRTYNHSYTNPQKGEVLFTLVEL